MDNEDQYIVGPVLVSLTVCGKKFLIFYDESEEGKKYKGKVWTNFEFGEQFSA
jgi:hypothetical protein